MLGLNIRRLCFECNQLIVRNLRNRRLDHPSPNPGLDKRLTAFKTEGIKIKDDDAEEFVEQSDSNFYEAGEVYNEHLNETLMGKYELRHQIVKEKYFKENMPNLLTWSEKEQIRHLANEHPDEWTPEKIAESFPVTVPVVKKLLKYPWKPATEERIARHDASAMRNWRELKEGSLSIPKELQKHFLKFSDRTIPPLKKSSIKTDFKKEEDLGEFERIIQRCAEKENINRDINTDNLNKEQVNSNEKVMKKDYKRITLAELTDKIQKRIEKGKDVNIPDKVMLDTVNTSIININEDVNNQIELHTEDNKENQLTAFKEENQKVLNIYNYPERIRIPKKAYKKGATYKISDCYYDHDGKFLYRVIGMSNKQEM